MTFRSWQITEQRPIEANLRRPADLSVPEPGPHQLRIKVGATGVCHTDLHIVEGDLPPHGLPRTPGHQVVGMVDATGEQVTEFNIGDRVGVGWLHSTCGRCAY
ncbi:MAG: alcohol dehydrogenase catalytic domain-containing protein [Dehalococcoidia bacterium]